MAGGEGVGEEVGGEALLLHRGPAVATGGGKATGLRPQRFVTVENWTVAYMQVRDVATVQAAIEQALNTIVRSKEFGAAPRKIPGVTVGERFTS